MVGAMDVGSIDCMHLHPSLHSTTATRDVATLVSNFSSMEEVRV